LKKRTSINSNSSFHKEKEMADFRKWIYALAVVALLAGFIAPASAQQFPALCTNTGTSATLVRAEGYTELVSDLVFTCTGGTPTAVGQPVQQINITVFLNTNITSRITAAPTAGVTQNFNEALLLFDEPNSARAANVPPAAGILNCGSTTASHVAPDTGASGPGVCAIFSTGNPAQTYDGGQQSGDQQSGTVGVCGAAVPASNPARTYPVSYGCGRPNVFQGRQGTPQNSGQFNAVTFAAVPFDPPGTTTTRSFRITNVRANAVAIGVSSTFTQAQIVANIAVSNNQVLTLSNPQTIVAYVNRGLSFSLFRARLDFIQCNSENPDLSAAGDNRLNAQFQVPRYRGDTSTTSSAGLPNNSQGYNPVGGFINPSTATQTGNDGTPMVRFTEGFQNAWKTRNIAYTCGLCTTATYAATSGNANFDGTQWVYNGNTAYPSDLAQDVPGSDYNTEAGFQFGPGGLGGGTTEPNINPPPTFATGGAFSTSVGNTAFNSLSTGINNAGAVSSATKLAVTYTNIPSGASVWVPPVLYLHRSSGTYATSQYPDPTVNAGTDVTGVMVLVSTAAASDGSSSVIAGAYVNNFGASTPAGNQGVLAKLSTPIALYEILYTNPGTLEIVDVPSVVAWISNPAQNLPASGVTTTATGSFAPFYSTAAAGQPTFVVTLLTGTLPIPRFTPGTGPVNLFLINKCACNLLFPYVVSASGFDTGIAIANSSSDPGATYGFSGVPQPGTIRFFYYGVMANGGAVPGSQESKSVPAGQVLTYVASTGSTDWGLDGRAAGLVGYIITQAQFQYCHGWAFLSATGNPNLGLGSYLALVLDRPTTNRTGQLGENIAH
jgi:hypothetical protein